MRRGPCSLLIGVSLLAPSCVTEPAEGRGLAGGVVPATTGRESAHGALEVAEKLVRVGLELVTEGEASVPADARGRYVPCIVTAGARQPALPPHPAGYLLAGVVDGASGPAAVRQALDAWRPGETLALRVLRNPYRSPAAEWWEREVVMWLPASGPDLR